MSVDFLIKCRDAHQQLADAYNEEAERRVPPEIKYGEKDVDGLFWETKTGTKDSYQQTSKRATNNHPVFQALQAILKEENGFCILDGYKYWNHQGDVDVIDRRKK